MRKFLIAVAAASIFGCGGEPDAEGELTAPSLQSIPTPAFTLGSDDTFGSIDGVAALGSNRIVVSDDTNAELLLFQDTDLIHRSGGRGEGPTEFRGLGAMHSIGNDSLLVLEPPRLRLLLFGLEADTLARLETIETPILIRSFCTLGSRIFVLGSHEGSLIHEIKTDGSILRSFAAPEEDPNPMVATMKTTGSIACSSELGAVAFATGGFGYIRFFFEDGARELVETIPDFSQVIFEGDQTAFRPRTPDIGYSHGVDGINWVGDGLLVNLIRIDADRERTRESRYWAQGQGWIDPVAEWGEVFAATEAGVLLRAEEDPFPKVRAYKVR